jgi:hypothetical protein
VFKHYSEACSSCDTGLTEGVDAPVGSSIPKLFGIALPPETRQLIYVGNCESCVQKHFVGADRTALLRHFKPLTVLVESAPLADRVSISKKRFCGEEFNVVKLPIRILQKFVRAKPPRFFRLDSEHEISKV